MMDRLTAWWAATSVPRRVLLGAVLATVIAGVFAPAIGWAVAFTVLVMTFRLSGVVEDRRHERATRVRLRDEDW
jgi:hypothetical protein